MRRLALVAFLLLGTPLAPDAAAQSVADADLASARRALGLDPFALAPYRFLSTNLSVAVRRRLIDELSRGAGYADQVVAARLELDGGQVVAARARLKAAAALLPDDTRSLDAYCQLALGAGAYAEAGAAARRALAQARTPQRLVNAALAELRQGRRKEGLELLAEARKKDPTGGAADAALDAMLGLRMTAEAAELLRAELDPSATHGAASATQWRRLADLERQLGHTERASDALLHALDGETSPTGRRAMAQMIMRVHRDKKDLPGLLRVLKDAKTSPRLVLRGDVETELGHTAAALACYEAAAKLDPSDPDPPLRLATAAKTPAERAARYAVLVAAHPGELRFALELADLRFAAKDDAGGKRTLREAATRLASAPAAQDQLARRLAEHGDLAGALECRRRAAELDPRNADYAIALGDAFRALGKRREATAAYIDSIARAGGVRSAWDRAIDALERAGYDEETRARYAEARVRWPADLALARRQAAALEHEHDYQHALEVWREVGRRSVQTFEKQQAKYNEERLDEFIRMAGQ